MPTGHTTMPATSVRVAGPGMRPHMLAANLTLSHPAAAFTANAAKRTAVSPVVCGRCVIVGVGQDSAGACGTSGSLVGGEHKPVTDFVARCAGMDDAQAMAHLSTTVAEEREGIALEPPCRHRAARCCPLHAASEAIPCGIRLRESGPACMFIHAVRPDQCALLPPTCPVTRKSAR